MKFLQNYLGLTFYLLVSCLRAQTPSDSTAPQNIRANPPKGVAIFNYAEKTVVAIQDAESRMRGTLFKSVESSDNIRLKDSYASSVNVFLVRDKASGTCLLIDTGFGRRGSQLLPRLKQLGIAPEKISAVFITHIHPDHVGGLLTPEGKIAFSNAEIHIAKKEYESWKKDPGRAGFAEYFAPYRKNLVLMDYDKAYMGLVPLFFPGHTPGHTVFSMSTAQSGTSGGGRILFVGDIVHAAELQIPNYRYCAGFDMEPKTAAESRLRLLRQEGVWFGAHIPFPGAAKIVRETDRKGMERFSYSPFQAESPK